MDVKWSAQGPFGVGGRKTCGGCQGFAVPFVNMTAPCFPGPRRVFVPFGRLHYKSVANKSKRLRVVIERVGAGCEHSRLQAERG